MFASAALILQPTPIWKHPRTSLVLFHALHFSCLPTVPCHSPLSSVLFLNCISFTHVSVATDG